MQRLKDGHGISLTCQVTGAGQAGGAGADHSHLVAIGLGLYDGGGVMLHGVVCNEALQTADADGFALDGAHALALTLAFLRAHTAADGRQCRGLLDLGGSLEELALGDERDEIRDLHADRAAGYAGLVFAVEAAGGLFDRHLRGVAGCDLVKVLVADVGVLFGHRDLGQRHIRHDYCTSILCRLHS